MLTILLISIFLSVICYIIYLYVVAKVDKLTIRQYDNYVQINKNGDNYDIDYNDIDYYGNSKFPETFKLNTMFENMLEVEVINLNENQEENIGIDYIPDALQFGIDTQNVHDSLVQDNIKKTHASLTFASNTGFLTDQDAFTEIVEAFPELNTIIEHIKTRNSNIYSINKTEFQVLKDVWTLARDSNDEDIKNELKFQLRDCVNEKGDLYCPTGVVTRITSSLNIKNPEELPKTKGMYREEILSKFSKMYKDTDYDEEMKEFIAENIINDYKNHGEETKKQVIEIIDEFIDSV